MILVDDGIATGASMLAAVRAVRAAEPARVVVAVPVGPPSACRQLAGEADDVVCATMPTSFEAVGQVYADFHQVTDDEVRELLADADALTRVAVFLRDLRRPRSSTVLGCGRRGLGIVGVGHRLFRIVLVELFLGRPPDSARRHRRGSVRAARR